MGEMTEKELKRLEEFLDPVEFNSSELELCSKLIRAYRQKCREVENLIEYWSMIEDRSADAHFIYQQEAHRRGDVRHDDNYYKLSEATKEWDRVLVRWVLNSIKKALSQLGKEE